MSARVLCNEIDDLLLAAHGPGVLDTLLHPPSMEKQRAAAERRERSLAILRGEVG